MRPGSSIPVRRLAAVLLLVLATGAPGAAARAADPAATPLTIEFSASAGDGDDRTRRIGPDETVRYGTARIRGTGSAGGVPIAAEVLGSLVYRDGSGPFGGAITITWPAGDLLALDYAAVVRATAEGTRILGSVTVLGGTGALAGVAGSGVVDGGRTGEIGTPTRYTLSLALTGLPDPAVLAAPPADPGAAVFTDPEAAGAALFRAYGDLMIAKDLAALDALLDPAFLIARADGSFADRATYLARLPDVRSFTASDVTEARSDGGVTVRLLVAAELFVDGRMFRPDPVPQLVAFRWTGHRWRLVSQANFSTPVDGPAPLSPRP
ncbi:MAG: DUF4440 domain-containing protein [Chloroflexota bacterium]